MGHTAIIVERQITVALGGEKPCAVCFQEVTQNIRLLLCCKANIIVVLDKPA